MSGWFDQPLSERGEKELDVLRERFREAPGSKVVYTSDLLRAWRTAEAISQQRAVLSLRSLREISCGVVDGWPVDRVKQELPFLWAKNEAQDDPGFSWPGGETYAHFRRRVLRAICAIAKRHPGEDVLVVTHAGVIAQVWGAIHGIPPARWSAGRPDNASLTVVEWEGRSGRIVRFNDVTHLEVAS